MIKYKMCLGLTVKGTHFSIQITLAVAQCTFRSKFVLFRKVNFAHLRAPLFPMSCVADTFPHVFWKSQITQANNAWTRVHMIQPERFDVCSQYPGLFLSPPAWLKQLQFALWSLHA